MGKGALSLISDWGHFSFQDIMRKINSHGNTSDEYFSEWKPTDAQFDAYLKREMEMALINLSSLVKLGVNLRTAETLHSSETVLRVRSAAQRVTKELVK